jgi:hypothetical protein
MARLGTTNDDAFVERAMIRINQVKPNFVPTDEPEPSCTADGPLTFEPR